MRLGLAAGKEAPDFADGKQLLWAFLSSTVDSSYQAQREVIPLLCGHGSPPPTMELGVNRACRSVMSGLVC